MKHNKCAIMVCQVCGWLMGATGVPYGALMGLAHWRLNKQYYCEKTKNAIKAGMKRVQKQNDKKIQK